MDTEFQRYKKLFYQLGLVIAGLLSVFLLVKILGEARNYRFIGSNPEVRSAISVSGKGEVFAVPDIATFSFGATERAATAKGAEEKVTAKINPALEYLKKEGIDEKDIKTSSYNVYPQYETIGAPCTPYSCPPSTNKISGYEASQMIEIKVRDTEKAGALISGVTEFGVNNISGINFSVDNEEALMSEARAKAIADAKEKAQTLAGDLDVRLVRIIEFSESNSGIPPYFKAYPEAAMGRGGDIVATPDLPGGENKFSSSVTITYEIR
jgi:uncharacterized protein